MKYYGLLILISILIFSGAYWWNGGKYRPESAAVKNAVREAVTRTVRVFAPPAPCTVPIKYSLGSFDTRFGISRETFLKRLATAELIWEDAEGANLFEYSSTTAGELEINLVYDERQRTTEVLGEKQTDIESGRATYESLKTELASLNKKYDAAKSGYETLAAEVRAKQEAYEAEVAKWNAQGGAPKKEYSLLEAKRTELNAEITRVNATRELLNSLAAEINTTIDALNRFAEGVNAKVEDFNTIVRTTGEEFGEGEYIRDEKGERINIYQFGTTEKLVRVLAHELGHALGMDHLDDKNAIMYRLNSGAGTDPEADDLAELARICKSK